MPLTESCSLQAYDQNIRAELRAGKPPEQAAAIARDVLVRACERAGKPVPKRTSKAATGNGKLDKPKSKKTREYLEAALEHARKMLPGWMFAIIHQAAMPSSGGRARANRRLEVMEKAWIEKAGCGGMTNGELKDALYKMNVAFASAKRQGKDTKGLLGRGAELVGEMKKRGLATPGALVQACADTKKGFLFGGAEGGVHAHAINRTDGKTGADGAHMHVFVLPGEGTAVYSAEDGAHEHELGPAMTKNDGKHSHRVYLPNGREVETTIDGKHIHDLMLETTTLCGSHQHSFALRDGTEVKSLTVAEYVDKFGAPEGPPGLLPPASVIVGSLEKSRMLAAELEMARMSPLPEAIEMVANGEQSLPPVPEAWEAVDVSENTVKVELADGAQMVVEKAGPVEVGDIVDVYDGRVQGFSNSTVPDDEEAVVLKRIYADEVRKATTVVPFHGPADARVVFVGSAPSEVEYARGEPLVGPDAEVFEELYLAPLGLARKDVGIGLACPVHACPEGSQGLWRPWLDMALKQCNGAMVVALGRVAKEALGDRAAFVLPHPSAVRRFGHSGEVTRKVRAMAKALDMPAQTVKAKVATRPTGQPSQGDFGATLAEPRSELRKGDAIRCRVVKSASEKQIVYGVVLDPYSVDLQNEWVPPATIEDTAHDFVEKSRVIGLKHATKADARLVESWVELYPSVKDREAALANMPHRVFRRGFGDDVIHSGSWVAGVRLSDELWDQYRRGELDAFSVGGFSFKTKVTTSAMPDVEFVDLAPSA
jgi:uracil-DNA glycosylase family 4